MKIVLLESLAVSDANLAQLAKPLLEKGHTFTAYPESKDPQAQLDRTEDADVIMLANMPLSGAVIRACEQLKFIDVAFTGMDHVDLQAAKAKGVAVSNCSGYSNESVAEHVLGMMLSLLRNVPQVDQRCRAGKTKEGLVGRELKGKTVGIVGLGAIGKRTAELCRAFGANVIAYQRHMEQGKTDLATFVTLEELLQRSDIVTLHCPLTDETKGLINKERIELMKPTAYLINAARGPVVNTQALVEALNGRHIAGAGIDVFEVEPPLDAAHPLFGAKNTILTPHIAFATQESMKLRAEIAFDNLHQWLSGRQVNVIL